MTKPLSAEETESITIPLWLWKEKKARIAELEGLAAQAKNILEHRLNEIGEFDTSQHEWETLDDLRTALGGQEE